MAKELEMVQSIKELRPVLVNLQVFASNNRSSKKASVLIQKAIEKNKMVDDKKSRVFCMIFRFANSITKKIIC